MTIGRLEHAFVPMADGVRLAVSLYLPADADPVPCVLEALPYRKDDLTSSYRPEYVRLRDDHGYAVARLDVRGTGSSEGIATDEYPEQEQRDLAEVIGWLAAAPWCSGAVGMYGTSYSGFNALQMAAERPPALRAVIAIYASDDRYADDVHYMGGALRWLDLVDYCHYMTPMNALPPVPAVYGDGWRAEWTRRLENAGEPWLFSWLEHQRRDGYWQHGSVRPDYDRIGCPTMLVAGWADGYRNNSLRTVEALAHAGTPHRLLAGPWSHMSTSSSLPGPRIDLVPEMVRWWDRWLRGVPNGVEDEPPVTWFARSSTRPQPDLDTVAGRWRSTGWPAPDPEVSRLPLDGREPYVVRPDVGTAAWISCAGHLPYGQPGDQRHDDADSVVWEWDADGIEILGAPRLRLTLVASEPVGFVSAKLCDVFADGTSALVTRGLLNLTRRDGSGRALALVPGEPVEVEVELETTAWRWDPGQRLRLSLAGTDWPNTVAPPRPLTVEVLDGELVLPLAPLEDAGPVVLVPGDAASDEGEPDWQVTRDVLRRTTTCAVDHGSTYPTPFGSATEHYQGEVAVRGADFAQRATADVAFTLTWPEVTAHARSTLEVTADADAFDVTVVLEVDADGVRVHERTWHRRFPRDLA